jgi:hypothetical protein
LKSLSGYTCAWSAHLQTNRTRAVRDPERGLETFRWGPAWTRLPLLSPESLLSWNHFNLALLFCNGLCSRLRSVIYGRNLAYRDVCLWYPCEHKYGKAIRLILVGQPCARYRDRSRSFGHLSPCPWHRFESCLCGARKHKNLRCMYPRLCFLQELKSTSSKRELKRRHSLC